MRGLPGSGKSTAAKNLIIENNGIGTIRSTDEQFVISGGGTYKFDPTLLGKHHATNQRLVHEDMKNNVPLIIVDNTNIRRADFAPYIRMANQFGYVVIENVIEWPPFTESYVRMCAERNQHGVPFNSISRMAERFEL